MNGISITIVDSTRVLIKFEHLLDLTDIPRIASIDSHTILSHGHFLLLDASKDWRTNQNPFVIGIPRIKFYLGVPLITKNGTVIGALSIFDSFGKRDFPSEKIKSFQNYAKEIMNVLDTPIEKLDKTNKKTTVSSLKLNEEFDGIKSLTRKIGRATSKGEQMTNIFEKDGSGGPYTQNSSFRFSRFNGKDDSDKINQLLFEKLFNCGNLKNGGTQLARFISSKFEVDFVYILEIRIAELYQIQKDFFPLKEKKVDAERFKHSNKLTKLTDDKGSNEGKKGNEYITRIIGHHGYNYTNLHFENEIHYAAFIAEFGIHYQNVRETSLYNDGIIMPFFRLNSKLIRKNRIKKGSTNDNIGDLEGNIDVYLRSGGYLIACFNEGIKKDAFNTNMISNVFEYASILRKIFISS